MRDPGEGVGGDLLIEPLAALGDEVGFGFTSRTKAIVRRTSVSGSIPEVIFPPPFVISILVDEGQRACRRRRELQLSESSNATDQASR